MSDFEIKEALQLRHQRFVAALRFATTQREFVDSIGHVTVRHSTFDEALEMADALIAKLEAPKK